mmetsp:Transcript_23689/g.43563  ORF Transcript_23689/g.43563 Transcript_23689/m.43563 type:complete len:96 (+) Transcript_23689:277-564(+)
MMQGQQAKDEPPSFANLGRIWGRAWTTPLCRSFAMLKDRKTACLARLREWRSAGVAGHSNLLLMSLDDSTRAAAGHHWRVGRRRQNMYYGVLVES